MLLAGWIQLLELLHQHVGGRVLSQQVALGQVHRPRIDHAVLLVPQRREVILHLQVSLAKDLGEESLLALGQSYVVVVFWVF